MWVTFIIENATLITIYIEITSSIVIVDANMLSCTRTHINVRTIWELVLHFGLCLNIKFSFPLTALSCDFYWKPSVSSYSTVQYSTEQYRTVQYSTVQCSTVQYSAVQYRTVQYSAVQNSTFNDNGAAAINKQKNQSR